MRPSSPAVTPPSAAISLDFDRERRFITLDFDVLESIISLDFDGFIAIISLDFDVEALTGESELG